MTLDLNPDPQFSEMTDPTSLSAALLHNEEATLAVGASQNNSVTNSVSEDGSYALSRMFSTPMTGQGQDDCIGTEPIDSGIMRLGHWSRQTYKA